MAKKEFLDREGLTSFWTNLKEWWFDHVDESLDEESENPVQNKAIVQARQDLIDNEIDERSLEFIGTKAEWKALPEEEKLRFDIINITDDFVVGDDSSELSKTITFNADGSITELRVDDTKVETVFADNGNIIETLFDSEGEIVKVKTTIFNDDGSITENVG